MSGTPKEGKQSKLDKVLLKEDQPKDGDKSRSEQFIYLANELPFQVADSAKKKRKRNKHTDGDAQDAVVVVDSERMF